MSQDELFEISGLKPEKLFADGELIETKSSTSSSIYTIKRTGDHYHCSCPGWRNQSEPVNARTCKHLRETLGNAYENARLEWKKPRGQSSSSKRKPSTTASSKPSSRSNKRSREEDDDEDDSPNKRRKPPSRRSTSSRKNYAEDNKDDDGEDGGYHATPGAPFAVLLANSWKIDGGQDVTGWWISEKLDGVRAYYDTKRVISRLGNPFAAPKEFLDYLPKDYTLDGELFAGRGKFSETISIVKSSNSPHWSNITYKVFDVPSKGHLPFEERMKILESLFGDNGKYKCSQVEVVKQTKVKDKDHVIKTLKEVESKGGEGIMLREPKSQYEGRRSNTLLKLKSFYDAEAKIVGYEPGSGRHQGQTGALRCVMECGKTFTVGSGLTDKQRRRPPKIGTIITYRFQEITKNGFPRFPTFVGEAIDKKAPKDAEIPDHRKNGASNGNA